MKAAILSLALALMLFVNVALYKPSDHEAVSESPTESSQMIPPADDIAPLAPPPKPIKPYVPPVVKSEVKPVKAVVSTETKPKQTEKPIYKRQKETKANWQTFEASYYTASCQSCSGITKSGYSVRNTIYYRGMRVIASDPNILPLGTIVEVVTNYGNFKAVSLDTGGRIKSKSIDILVETKEEAYKLGRHSVKLRVVGKIDDI